MFRSETDHTLDHTRSPEGPVSNFPNGKCDDRMICYLVTPLQRFKERIEASVGLRHRNILDFFGHITIDATVYSVCRVHRTAII